MKIYTKTGDKGMTGLIGGKRVSKSSARLSAYGAVDELNAMLGLARAETDNEATQRFLLHVQNDLFRVGAELAAPPSYDLSKLPCRPVDGDDVQVLEKAMDEEEKHLPPLREFILPGGEREAALFHLARAVCRRAERRVVALSEKESVSEALLVYLNRLSDLFFVLARSANARAGRKDLPWKKSCDES